MCDVCGIHPNGHGVNGECLFVPGSAFRWDNGNEVRTWDDVLSIRSSFDELDADLARTTNGNR